MIKRILRKLKSAPRCKYKNIELVNENLTAVLTNSKGSKLISQALEEGAILDSGKLILDKNYYLIEGKTYKLTEPGRYYFYRIPNYSRQVIIFGDSIIENLSYVSSLFLYGNLDKVTDMQSSIEKLGKKSLILGCSDISRVSAHILNSVGIQSRIVASYTTEDWTGEDDSHTLLEVKDKKGEWFTFDPSIGFYSERKLIDICFKYKKKSFRQTSLKSNIGTWRTDKYDYYFWVHAKLNVEEQREKWYRRVMQVPMYLNDQNYFEFPKDGLSVKFLKKMEVMGFKGITNKELFTRYYR